MTVNDIKVKLNNIGGQFAGIYLIKDKATGEPYVGKAQHLTDRVIQHINNTKAKSGIDKKIAEKGINAFEYEILEVLPGANDNLLFFREQYWIEKLDAKNSGSNLTGGNHKHNKKWLSTLTDYLANHTVSTQMLKLIAKQDPAILGQAHYTLIHEYDDEIKNRLRFDDSEITQIQSIFTKRNNKGELKEDGKELASYITEELENMKLSNRTDLGEAISNPPYGYPSIAHLIVKDFNYNKFYNLEPGNDYFYKDKLYKYLDPSFKPIICRNGCFKDASQTTVIARLQKEKNNLTELDARILLHIDTNGDQALSTAISEYLRKAALVGTLRFVQKDDVIYNDDLFVFNPGAFDIHHGYFAVYDSKKKAYTSSTNFNLFGQDTTGHRNSPTSKVRGCKGFKKIMYSNSGLKLLHVLFDTSPEGWGFLNGFFADLDYTGMETVVDLFNAIGLSAESQNTLLQAISRITLTAEEEQLENIAKGL